MPTPLGHTLTGVIIHTIIRKKRKKKQSCQSWMCLLFCIIFSSLPDIDFISLSNSSNGFLLPGVGLSWENHHGPTHSLGFVILTMLVVMVVARIFQKNWKQWGFISGLCVFCHVFMDTLIVKKGLMLFYPLSTHRISLVTGFPFGYSPEMGFVGFVVISAVEEAIILGCILAIVWRIMR